MAFLVTLLAILLVAVQNVFKKQSGSLANGRLFATMLFNGMTVAAGGLFFLLYAGFRFAWQWTTVGYGLMFAVAFCVTIIFSFLAISEGSLALSSLVLSYSCMIPTVYGMFMGDEVTWGKIGGIVSLLLSLFFFNSKGEQTKNTTNITLRWVVYAFLAFVGNGMCSTIQKMYQTQYDGACMNEFMLVAYVFSGIIVFGVLLALIVRKDPRPAETKNCFLWGTLTGLANAGANLAVITLNRTQPASWLFPMISAGGVLVAFLVALFFYKEKQTPRQIVGFVLGLLSILLIQL